MTRARTIIALLTCLFIAYGSAQAGAHRSGAGMGSQGGPEGMDMLAKMGEKLDLSDPQAQELGSLMEIYRPRFEELAKRGKANRKDLLAMAPDDPRYSALTDEVSAEAGRTAAEVVVLMAELQVNAYSLLNYEQQAKYRELRASMPERMQAHREAMRNNKGKGHHGKHHGGHHGKHGEGQMCEHGEDGVCPHHPNKAAAPESE